MNYFNPYQEQEYFYYYPPLQRNYHTNPFLNSRGSWTPFSWVEKYNYIFSGPYNKAEVALTFDDGPDPIFTPLILDKLKRYDVKATFFLLGVNIEKFPEIAKRISEEGHVIGNHTYNHPKLTQVSDEEYHHQIHKSDEIIQSLIGYKPKFFRPTYGAINENQVQWATEQGMMVTQWSIDTLDWQGLSAEIITQTVMRDALPGSIILQHNAPDVPLQGSVDALDQIILGLKGKGARFVTLPEMFGTTKQR